MTARRIYRLGTFRARRTKDAEALRRDGQAIYQVNELSGPEPEVEVLFGDGMWMIVHPEDIVPLENQSGGVASRD